MYTLIHQIHFCRKCGTRQKKRKYLFLLIRVLNDNYEITIVPSTDMVSGKQAWIWDPATGERYMLDYKW